MRTDPKATITDNYRSEKRADDASHDYLNNFNVRTHKRTPPFAQGQASSKSRNPDIPTFMRRKRKQTNGSNRYQSPFTSATNFNTTGGGASTQGPANQTSQVNQLAVSQESISAFPSKSSFSAAGVNIWKRDIPRVPSAVKRGSMSKVGDSSGGMMTSQAVGTNNKLLKSINTDKSCERKDEVVHHITNEDVFTSESSFRAEGLNKEVHWRANNACEQ